MSMHINAILVFRTEYEKPEHQQQVLDYEVWTIHADISSISNCSRSRPRPKLVSQHRDLGVQDRDFHNRVSRTIILRICVFALCNFSMAKIRTTDHRNLSREIRLLYITLFCQQRRGLANLIFGPPVVENFKTTHTILHASMEEYQF